MPLAKRRLTDLFILGKQLTLDDGYSETGPDGEVIDYEPVTVWVQKMNPVEQAEASRHADAARARYLAVKSQHESDEYMQQMNAVLSFGDDLDQMATFIIGDEAQKTRAAVTARLSSEERWSKDNYLQGLYDSWNGPLKDEWLKDNNHEEASRVFVELSRFNKEVDDEVEVELQPLIDSKKDLDIGALRHLMVERMIDLDAGQQWMDEFYRWQMYLNTREPEDHKKKYFLSRAEVDELSHGVVRILREAFQELEVEVQEGKFSPGTPPSSPSSEAPAEEETEVSSGQLVSVQ